jgi:hypothetical protein
MKLRNDLTPAPQTNSPSRQEPTGYRRPGPGAELPVSQRDTFEVRPFPRSPVELSGAGRRAAAAEAQDANVIPISSFDDDPFVNS